MTMLPAFMADSPSRSSFTRSGSDQLGSASLPSGEALGFSYDASFGQLTAIGDAGGSGFSLGLTADALLHLPLSQTVRDAKSGETLLAASIAYDADGLRASRTVSGSAEGQGSSTTNYWHGGGLHPLVVSRDGVDYRLIGKGVIESATGPPMRSYLQADRLGSVRMVADDQGKVVQSLGYDDYGLTRIEGQSAAASFASMASFYRFQGQEQEVFPLAKLSIDNDALASWLDQIQLYHFPWRDYAAGLAAFTQTDPVPTEDSLYAALGANPVNYTDETGGMWGVLANIDPETQRLFDLIADNPNNPNVSLSEAQVFQLRQAIDRVLTENTTELHKEFHSQLSMLRSEIEKLDTAMNELADARLEGRIERLNFKASMHHLGIELQLTRSYFREIFDWASNYDSRRGEWLHKYAVALAKFHFHNVDDDEKDDEKDAAASIASPLEESSSASEEDNETRPLLNYTDSDDDAVHDLTIGGGQNTAPARIESDDESLNGGGTGRDDNQRIRCCNIL